MESTKTNHGRISEKAEQRTWTEAFMAGLALALTIGTPAITIYVKNNNFLTFDLAHMVMLILEVMVPVCLVITGGLVLLRKRSWYGMAYYGVFVLTMALWFQGNILNLIFNNSLTFEVDDNMRNGLWDMGLLALLFLGVFVGGIIALRKRIYCLVPKLFLCIAIVQFLTSVCVLRTYKKTGYDFTLYGISETDKYLNP